MAIIRRPPSVAEATYGGQSPLIGREGDFSNFRRGKARLKVFYFLFYQTQYASI